MKNCVNQNINTGGLLATTAVQELAKLGRKFWREPGPLVSPPIWREIHPNRNFSRWESIILSGQPGEPWEELEVRLQVTSQLLDHLLHLHERRRRAALEKPLARATGSWASRQAA